MLIQSCPRIKIVLRQTVQFVAHSLDLDCNGPKSFQKVFFAALFHCCLSVAFTYPKCKNMPQTFIGISIINGSVSMRDVRPLTSA